MNARIRTLAGALMVCVAIVAVGLVGLPLPAMAQGDSFLPLHEGNCWLFVNDVNPWIPEIEGMMVVDTYHLQGQHVCCVADFFMGVAPGTIHLYEFEGNTLERFKTAIGLLYPWSDLSQPVVIPSFRPDCMHGARGHFGEAGPIDVPAGHFEDAQSIVYDELPCCDAGPWREVYVRGVGLVQRSVLTFAGIRTWSLVYARVDGISIGDPSFVGRWQSGSPGQGDGADDDGPGVVLSTWSGIKDHYR